MFEHLRCPETLSELTEVDSERLNRLQSMADSGQLFNQAGQTIKGPIEKALINADQSLIFLVREGIVSMILDQAVATRSFEENQ